jgi:hypothetical protein
MNAKEQREVENWTDTYLLPIVEKKVEGWKRIVSIQRLWNWTFAILFTLILFVLALVAKSFREIIELQEQKAEQFSKAASKVENYLEHKKLQDDSLAQEYRNNMKLWKEE